MNRKTAKFLTAVGAFSCLSALILSGFTLMGNAWLPQIFIPSLFVGGVVAIVFSLAFYTEK